MSCGPLLHHPRPLRLRRLPDTSPAGVPGCCTARRDAPSPAALLRQVSTCVTDTELFLLLCCFYTRAFSHLSLRYLCDRVVPGNRVTIMGIYSIKKMAAPKAKGKERGVGVGIRASYLRVVGIQVDTEGAGEEVLH